MAPTNPTLKQELAEYNQSLDNRLRGNLGMTLRTFKTIKALTQLVGAAAGIYAMSLGAPPLATFALTAVIISGPEALEYIINQE
jgi:hypothetical protein